MIGLTALAAAERVRQLCRGARAVARSPPCHRCHARPRMSRWQPRWPAYAAKARLTRALPASAVIAPASVAMGADR